MNRGSDITIIEPSSDCAQRVKIFWDIASFTILMNDEIRTSGLIKSEEIPLSFKSEVRAICHP